jgi:hypothetical protein
MRKLFAVVLAVIALSSVQAFAQQSFLPGSNPNFQNKDLYVGAHLGLGGGFYGGLGPVLNVEYGVLSNLGVTASIGFFGYTYNPVPSYSWSYTQIPVIVGANYHFDLLKVSKLDTWVGIGLGYVIGSWTSTDAAFNTYPSSSYFTWDARLGGRYYLTDKLAVKVELGYWALGYLRAGIDFKL